MKNAAVHVTPSFRSKLRKQAMEEQNPMSGSRGLTNNRYLSAALAFAPAGPSSSQSCSSEQCHDNMCGRPTKNHFRMPVEAHIRRTSIPSKRMGRDGASLANVCRMIPVNRSWNFLASTAARPPFRQQQKPATLHDASLLGSFGILGTQSCLYTWCL